MFHGLRRQLLTSHLLPVGLMLLALGGAIAGFFQLGRSVDRILKDNYQSVVAAQNMKETLERQDSAATFFLAGQAGRARRQYEDNRHLFAAAFEIEAHNITELGEGRMADDIGRQFAVYHRDLERLLYAAPPLPTPRAREFYFGRLEPEFVRLKQRAQDVLELNQAAILREDRRAKAEARRDALLGVGATAATALFATLLAWRMIGAIMTPLVTLTWRAEEIGAGRLNQQIDARRSDEIGQLARTFNTMAERLSEARRAEEERLRRAERMTDAALENLYDPVIVTDEQARIVHLNRAAEKLFGSSTQARGRIAREIVHEDRLAHAIEQAVGREHTSAEEGAESFVSFRENPLAPGVEAGEPRTYRLRANPMWDGGENGGLLGAVAVLENVTYLAELDRLKTEFIGVAAHELRTPVTSMLLGIQLLQEGAVGPLTSAQQEVVNATREDLQRLERMMRDLLDLTRLEAGATPPRFESVWPEDLVRGAARALASQAQAKSVELTVDLPSAPQAVWADRGQITRVLVNLVNNAVRHTARGGAVHMAATPTGDGKQVCFSVTDTGTGIPPEYLKLIFERFVQVPGATRGGAGLGLSLSRTIVHAHGSEIHAESRIGAGSTFTFTLPVAPE